MGRIFGNKEGFAIEYELLQNKFDEYGVIGESWGELRLWIEGQDVCEFKFDKKRNTHIWNIYYIIEWFCNHLFYIFGFDPYPLPVEGCNTLEKEEKTAEFENMVFAEDEYENLDKQIEFDLWFTAKNEWHRRHTWATATGGCDISCVYFSRNGNTTEIMWNNQSKNGNVEFLHKRGVYNMPHKEFRNIIINFLRTIIKELDIRCGNGNETNEWKQKIRLFLWPYPFE